MDRSPSSGGVRRSPAARFHQQMTLRDDLTTFYGCSDTLRRDPDQGRLFFQVMRPGFGNLYSPSEIR